MQILLFAKGDFVLWSARTTCYTIKMYSLVSFMFYFLKRGCFGLG